MSGLPCLLARLAKHDNFPASRVRRTTRRSYSPIGTASRTIPVYHSDSAIIASDSFVLQP